MFAERSAHAHVTHNGAGYARREAFRRRVAAGTVLLEYALALILLLGGLFCIGGCPGWSGDRRAALLCANRERGNRNQDKDTAQPKLRVHHRFPFQAGTRKRYTIPVSQMF